MTPAQAIAQLDRQIAKSGQPVTLRRLVPGSSPIDAVVTGFARKAKPEDVVNGIDQAAMFVTLSPTDVVAANFPLPVVIGDKVLIAGDLKNVEAPEHVRMLDQIVRINLQVLG